jgi:hypothetical protein
VTRLAERLVKADHVDAAEFMHLMTVGGFSATAPRAPGAPALLAGFFALSHTFDGRRGSMKPEGRRRWRIEQLPGGSTVHKHDSILDGAVPSRVAARLPHPTAHDAAWH